MSLCSVKAGVFPLAATEYFVKAPVAIGVYKLSPRLFLPPIPSSPPTKTYIFQQKSTPV